MEELKFELGEWVGTDNGYGQILYIRPFFVEDYEDNRQDRKNGEFIKYIYVCKNLCGFEGKIKKSKRIDIYTSISKIDKKGLLHLKNIKEHQKEEYQKYIFFDDKLSINKQLFRYYKLDNLDFDKTLIEDKIKEINNKLYPAFTYREFVKVFKEYDFPFKIENMVQYGEGNKNSIMLRFDSFLYKVKEKEVIFNNVRVF
jgi:hypothetical protein